MLFRNATDVRKKFSQIIDITVREKPQFIKRTRDYLFLSDIRFLDTLLSAYDFTARKFIEDDGSVTLSLNEIDLAENAATEESARRQLAQSIIEYAEDFYNEFNTWSAAPNRKKHIPLVFKALIIDDVDKIGELIQCQNGQS